MSRFRAILGRWISLICCGALVSAIWVFVGSPVGSLLGSAVQHLASIRSDLLASAVLIAAVAGCWPFGHRRWLAFFGLRHFWTYPPLWVAIAIALLVITVHTGMTSSWQPVFDGVRAGWWLITEVPPWLWIGSGAVAVLDFVTSNRAAGGATKKNSDGADLAVLVDWLQDDREISDPKDDWFHHDAVALRIVGRLTESDGESPTMAVVGPLGSGKSTIRRLVAHHLAEHPSVQMLDLSLWPFDSAEAAVAGVLRAVIRSLGQHVNTLAVTGLSERYVTTIERVAGKWGSLARYLRGESRPEAILEGLAAIATAVGVKLVLWIEDMERFTGADRLPPQEAAIREAERLGPILSLLYLLDRCDSISVIVGDTSLRSRLDVGKIARFVESPPRPTPQLVWRKIEILRSACLAETFIDPANDEYRKVLTPPEDDTHLDMWLWNIRDMEPSVQEAFTLLLNTPRAFKWALRLTWETWARLRGEIDFDSVLIASALRVARPDVFALIDEHSDLFRHGFRDPLAGRHSEQAQHPVLAQLDALLKKEETERMRNAVKAVISFVFPAAFRTHEIEGEYVACPQGLSVDWHTNYWHRYLTLPFVPDDESDQGALRAIAAWKDKEENDLVVRLLDARKAAQLETFVGQFTASELCRLLTELAAVLREHSAAGWEDEREAPGITSVWRMMHRRSPSPEVLSDALNRLIRDLTPHHLPLINDIHYFFATAGSNVPQLLDEPTRNEVNAVLIDTFRSSFPPGSSERLLLAVRDGSPYIVYWICWGRERLLSKQTQGQPFDQWPDIAKVLLEAAEQAPERGVPLIVPFVTKSNLAPTYRATDESSAKQLSQDFIAEFDEEAAQNLFDYDRLIRILAATEKPPHLEGQLAVQFDAAREAALAKSTNQSDPSSAVGDGAAVVLTESQRMVLTFLSKQSVAQPRTYIADILPADRSSVSKDVKALVGYKLVTDHGRNKGVSISQGGREWLKQA